MKQEHLLTVITQKSYFSVDDVNSINKTMGFHYNILYNSYFIANIDCLNVTQHITALSFNILGNGWFTSERIQVI